MFIQSQFPHSHRHSDFRDHSIPISLETDFSERMDRSYLSVRAQFAICLGLLEQMIQNFMGEEMLPSSVSFGRASAHCLNPVHDFLARPKRRIPESPRPPFHSLRSGEVSRANSDQVSTTHGVQVRPLHQSNSVSCGQASVAMAVNALTGKSLSDRDVNRKYGFSLLHALRSESGQSGFHWRDAGNFSRSKWSTLERKLNREKTPVLIGLSGPRFSPSGRGHIVTLLSVQGDRVQYADPADGKIKFTTRRAIESAPPHPDGKFLFVADRL